MKYLVLIGFIFIFCSSCKIDQGRIEVTLLKKSNSSKLTGLEIANVQFNNHQLIITGTNLNSVTQINMQNTNLGFAKSFTIESKSATKIVANANSAVTFATSAIFDLILSNASAAATYTVDFSLCNALLGGKQIDCSITPSNNYVLTYDGAANKWKPKALTGLTYAGTHDASGGAAPTAQPAGTYYIISVAGTISTVSFVVGDWIVSNGAGYQKVPNPGGVASVFGRTGAIVATEGDYNLDKLSDVDLTTPATTGQVLKYDGTKWIAGTDDSFGGAGSVNSATIQDGSIVGADIANDTITLAKLNGTSDATKYLRGDKSWAALGTDVQGTVVSTYSISANLKPAIANTDTIAAAFNKIQKFLNDLNTDYVSKSATSQTVTGSWSFTNPTSFLYTQTPTGATATEVTNVAYVQSYVDNAFASGGAYAPATLTTVNGAHTNAVTTLTVASTAGYPSTGTLLVGSEIIPYTGKTGTTFTGLTRGGFGTTAAAISNGVSVNNFLLLARNTTSSTPKFVVTGDGKVGIGAANPASALEVVGGDVIIDNARAFAIRSNAGTIRPILTFDNSNVVKMTSAGGGITFDAVSSTVGMTDAVGDVFRVYGSIGGADQGKSVFPKGNVGVGTTTPVAKMDISGEVKIGETGLVCNASTKGSIRYNNTSSALEFCNGSGWNLVQAAACSNYSPSAITFFNEANAVASTLTTSNIVQVTGINCNIPVQISGQGSPQFQICSDNTCSSVVQSWTSSPANITNNQYLQVRLTSDSVGGSSFNANVIIGGSATVWNVTTAGGDCTASPTPGTVCADGTIYAGLSPDGNNKMFTTRCDAGMTWDGANCTGSRLSMTWNNGSANYETIGVTSGTTGRANSATLAANAGAGAPYAAANYCESLSANGHTDWYLPAIQEMNILCGNKNSIRNFLSGGYDTYWGSTEINSSQTWFMYINGCNQANDGGANKHYSTVHVRCVRR